MQHTVKTYDTKLNDIFIKFTKFNAHKKYGHFIDKQQSSSNLHKETNPLPGW